MTRLPVPPGAVLLLAGIALQAQPLDLSGLSNKLQEFKLANGLTVAVLERKDAPVVSVALVVRAGYIYDPPGKRGIAVLFEDLLGEGPEIRGSRNPAAEKAALKESEAAADRWEALRRKGAGDTPEGQRALVDAKMARERAALLSHPRFTRRALEYHAADAFRISTGPDLTLITARLPSTRVEPFFLLFGEWFRSPFIRNFYFHANARARALEAAPPSADQLLLSAVSRTAFANHRYGFPPAAASELERLRAGDAQAFAERHYTPNNAGLVLVGDIGVEEARRLAELHFGKAVPSTSRPTPPAAITSPGQAPPPPETPTAVAVVFQRPPETDPDDVVMDRITLALTAGPKSRARQELVEKERMPGFAPLLSLPGGGMGGVTGLAIAARSVAGGQTAAESIGSLYERVAESGLDESEMRESARMMRQNLLNMMPDSSQMATLLARHIGVYSSSRALIDVVARFDAVTPDDTRRVAKKYFTPERRVVIGPGLVPAKTDKGAAQ